jgi:hypothetical protein
LSLEVCGCVISEDILKLMNFSKWLYIAKAGLIYHFYPVRLYKTYITKQQEFNSGFLVVNLSRPKMDMDTGFSSGIG